MLKNILFGGAIAASLAIGIYGQSGTPILFDGSLKPQKYIREYNSNRLNETTDNLTVNTENKTRIITDIPEIKGITQMKDFADNSEYEESWLYFPQDSVWKETGYGETGWTDDVYPENRVSLDSLFIMEELERTSEAITYHFHPIKGYPDPRKTGLEIDQYFARMMSDEQIESAIYLGNTVPSYPDIHKAIIIQKRFPERDEGDIRHKQVSSLGVTEYSFTQKGIDMIREGKSSELEKKIKYDQAVLARYVVFKNAEAYEEGLTVRDTKEYAEYNAEELLKAWRNDYMKITFTPFKKLGIE